jgi:hypothetical protein
LTTRYADAVAQDGHLLTRMAKRGVTFAPLSRQLPRHMTAAALPRFRVERYAVETCPDHACGQRPCLVSVPTHHTARALAETARAKRRFGLPYSAEVLYCCNRIWHCVSSASNERGSAQPCALRSDQRRNVRRGDVELAQVISAPASTDPTAPWGRFPHFSGRRRFEDDRDGPVPGISHTGAGRVASPRLGVGRSGVSILLRCVMARSLPASRASRRVPDRRGPA